MNNRGGELAAEWKMSICLLVHRHLLVTANVFFKKGKTQRTWCPEVRWKRHWQEKTHEATEATTEETCQRKEKDRLWGFVCSRDGSDYRGGCRGALSIYNVSSFAVGRGNTSSWASWGMRPLVLALQPAESFVVFIKAVCIQRFVIFSFSPGCMCVWAVDVSTREGFSLLD